MSFRMTLLIIASQLHFFLSLSPLVSVLRCLLETLEMAHDLLVKQPIVPLDLGIAFLFKHVLFLNVFCLTFLLSLLKLSV